MGRRPPQTDGRALIDVALGGLAPIGVAAILVGVRGHVSSVNVALALTVVVVAAGALGGRAAGAVAALSAALSYDFFHTRPYLSLTIHGADDVEMTVQLLVLGLISGQLAWKARLAATRLAGGRSELERIRRLADQVARGFEPADVIMAAQAELFALLDPVTCRFEAAPFTDRLDLPRLERDGAIEHMHRYRLQPGGELELELPGEGLALPVLARGQIIGRFVLDFAPAATASLEQRVVSVALADQVGASLAIYPPPLTLR
jgi:K+-sensing histidine kinase KdpD